MRTTVGRDRESGQALAETGIVLLLMLTLAMGIVEFGRMLMLVNMVTSATRDAARFASAVPRVDRQTNGDLCTPTETAMKQVVENQLLDVGLVVDPGNVTIVRVPDAVPPTLTVTTSVDIPWIALFNLVGTNLSVNRSVTFRDEHVGGDGTC